ERGGGGEPFGRARRLFREQAGDQSGSAGGDWGWAVFAGREPSVRRGDAAAAHAVGRALTLRGDGGDDSARGCRPTAGEPGHEGVRAADGAGAGDGARRAAGDAAAVVLLACAGGEQRDGGA